MAKATFETLNPNAPLFSELKSGNYTWWKNIKDNDKLYIEIRKDNDINVYFEGGSVVKLHYCSKHKKIQAKTHRKYLGGNGTRYVECSLDNDNDLKTIINNIPNKYSGKKGYKKENLSEKYIQSQYIIKYHSKYIDSEFAYKDDYKDDSLDIRIDLIECINGELRFVELKTIDDGRMLKKTDDNPEVVKQVKAYEDFISKHKQEIVEYYQKVWEIKKDLGLITPEKRPSSLADKPLLLIFNRWTNLESRRKIHTRRLIDILDREKIDYIIKEDI